MQTNLDVDSDIATDTDLLGKVVTDLQEDIEINGNEITGSLKHVTGYTGFSGDPALQEGNYLALHFSADTGATISVELLGGTDSAKELDADGLAIFRIANTTQRIKVTSTLGSLVDVKHYSLTGLTLEGE